MDDFSYDSFNEFFPDDSNGIKWSERDWARYVRKSDEEIGRFSSIYSINRLMGKTLEEISTAAGWPIDPPKDDYLSPAAPDAEFSYEPWTLLNHPVYIITRALFRCMEEHAGRLLEEVNASTAETWGFARSVSEASNHLSMAVNSTDLGEDVLARCNYKMGAASLNRLLARVDALPQPQSPQGKERLVRIKNIVFDLRQLCLNLSEQSRSGKQV